MPLSQDELHDLAHALMEAEHNASPIPPLTERSPGITSEEAYAVAAITLAHELEHGHRVVGRKVGLTSKPMQVALGIDTPDFGTILDDMTVRDGGRVETAKLISPKAEPELAFRLKAPLRGPGATAADALAATDYVFPALEVIDSRIADWRIKEQDTIADNGSSARVVIGSARLPADALDLAGEEVVLYCNGEERGRAQASEVLGNPANAVAWCANKLAEFGEELRAGEFVMPGSITAAVDVRAGDSVRAEFASLGAVSVRFV